MNKNVWLAPLALCLWAGYGMDVCAQTVGHARQKRVDDSVTVGEVVVLSARTTATANSVSTRLEREDIARSMGKSLASMLENTSGMSSIQTGTIVAKPVIHGMYGNRILIVTNGARLTGQQWGTDHAPEVDKNGFAHVEVVKGAESVRYGSEAMAGIVVMEQGRLPYHGDKIHGTVSALYGSNGRRYGLVARAEGTVPGHGEWAWRVQGTFENGGDRSTARYLLNNTGMRERDFAVSMGYDNGRWRAEAGYGLFWQKLGVMRSAQMGNEQLLQERIALGQPVEFTPFSYGIDYPHQKVVHHTLFGRVRYDAGGAGRFDWQTTFQTDNRRENRIRRMNHSDIPTVSLGLRSLQNTLTWQRGRSHWKSEAGLQLVNTKNSNERGTGVVPVIPNYTEVAFGAYGVQKYTHNRWGGEGGVRFDMQQTEADGYDWTGRRYGGRRHFENATFTLGAHYRPAKQLTLTSNLGLAWRAPHVYELYSNGNELGSGMFVRGDSTMKSEQSYKWITSVDYRGKLVSVRVDAYLQWVNNYIYDEPTRRNIVVVSGAYPVFQYKQTGAYFRGVDVDVHIRPLAAIDYRMFTALVRANERGSNSYLPYIPSTRITQTLTWRPRGTERIRPWVSLSHRYVGKQKRFDPARDLVDFTPEAYHLLAMGIGATMSLRGTQTLELAIMGDNILNKEYKEYTNRSRYYAHDMGRDIRCTLSWHF